MSRHTWSTNVIYSFKQVQGTRALNTASQQINMFFNFHCIIVFWTWFNEIPWIFPSISNSHWPFWGWQFLRKVLHLPGASISCEKLIFCLTAINFIEFRIHLYIHATFPHICMKKSQAQIFISGFFFCCIGWIFFPRVITFGNFVRSFSLRLPFLQHFQEAKKKVKKTYKNVWHVLRS